MQYFVRNFVTVKIQFHKNSHNVLQNGSSRLLSSTKHLYRWSICTHSINKVPPSTLKKFSSFDQSGIGYVESFESTFISTVPLSSTQMFAPLRCVWLVKIIVHPTVRIKYGIDLPTFFWLRCRFCNLLSQIRLVRDCGSGHANPCFCGCRNAAKMQP